MGLIYPASFPFTEFQSKISYICQQLHIILLMNAQIGKCYLTFGFIIFLLLFLVLTIFSEGAYLTFKSSFHKALNLF